MYFFNLYLPTGLCINTNLISNTVNTFKLYTIKFSIQTFFHYTSINYQTLINSSKLWSTLLISVYILIYFSILQTSIVYTLILFLNQFSQFLITNISLLYNYVSIYTTYQNKIDNTQSSYHLYLVSLKFPKDKLYSCFKV